MFPVYSIAKPFLAQAVLELNLPLTDQIGKHLPGLAAVYASRQIDQLLNHTSGLADYSFLKEYGQAVDARDDAWSREELLERCLVFPHTHQGFQYSNIGYLLLRMLVEAKTDLSMFQAIEQLVLQPLNIEGFTPWETKSDLVPDYDPRWVYSGTFLADQEAIKAGFLKLAKHRSQTIGIETGLAHVPYPNTGFDNPGYSYGFMCDSDGESKAKYVGHGGGGPGYSHMLLINTDTWQADIESSTTDFNQTEAILRLRSALN